MSKLRQRIRYATAQDGARLAWAESGQGSVLVKAANWMTHLEYERESPVWGHWIRFFTEHFRYIRHDERGCGMTDHKLGALTIETWTSDLETVIDAAKPAMPFALLGISQGAAASIAYAVKYPERVSQLILYGGYARGVSRRRDSEKEKLYRAMIELVRHRWGDDNPAFRQIFTSRFLPGGTEEQIGWFNELCKKTTTSEIAAKLLEARATLDVVHLLEKVSVPTLVLHSRDDDVVPVGLGHELAASIEGAEFVELDSQNHVLLESEPAWDRFREEVLRFTGRSAQTPEGNEPFANLTQREMQILGLLTEGLANAQIASHLSISEKTVRNHFSNIFDKLGVWSRAQAIVFARDHGFKH